MSAARFAVPIVFIAALMSQARADCIVAEKADQQAEGRLDQIKFTDEAYERTEIAFILTLRKPACLTGRDEYDNVVSASRIHVFLMDDKILRQLRSNIGKTIRVKGTAFGEQTAHHHAPIVMNVFEIARR